MNDTRAECKKIKKRCHALAKGRDQMEANSSFAHAYQMRCTSDWIWVHALGEQGDWKHAKYLQLERQFRQLASKNTQQSAKDKQEIEKLIAEIKG